MAALKPQKGIEGRGGWGSGRGKRRQPQRQSSYVRLVLEAPPAQLDSAFNLIVIIVCSPYVTLSHQDKPLTAC